jgi:hypothetical protein
VSSTLFRGLDLARTRLYWVFMTDVYDAYTSGGCRLSDPDAVGGGYRLDDVSFTYDLVRLVPATTSCTSGCDVFVNLLVDPPGPRCPGEPVVLSAEASDGACPTGALEYRFTGPGLDTGYTPAATAVAVGANGARFGVTARCADLTACARSLSVVDPTRDELAGGRFAPASLRVRRAGADLVLAWAGTVTPAAYAVARAGAARDDGPARWAALAALGADPLDPGLRAASPTEPAVVLPAEDGDALSFFRVGPRPPCDVP